MTPSGGADPARAEGGAARREAEPMRDVFARRSVAPTGRLVSDAAEPARRVRLCAGETLYRQGDPVPFFYLIGTGHLKLFRTSSRGDTLIVELLAAGALFGPGLTTARLAGHTAVAKSAATLSRYGPECLERAAADDPAIATRVVNELADRLQRAERRLQAMLGLDVRSRLAMALRDLAVETGTRCPHGHEIDVPITQQELAELIGASRPTVSLELNALRRRGLLSYTRRFICLDRPDALIDWIEEEAAGVSRRTDAASCRD